MNLQETKLVLQDQQDTWKALLPLTYTRPISDLRIGIDTIKEKWEWFLSLQAEVETEDYLLQKFQNKQPDKAFTLIINSSIIPNKELIVAIKNLKPQESLEHNNLFIAAFIQQQNLPLDSLEYDGETLNLSRPWHLFIKNGLVLQQDFERLTSGRKSEPIPKHVHAINEKNIFIEPGAVLENCVLDATTGPIYIGEQAQIMHGALIKGALSVGTHSIIKMGTKHYGPSTLGPYCKIGGEVSNVVMQAYSNKGHDGYLGNAVLGEWCNLGADTNASNLKNNYSEVSAFSYLENKTVPTGQQFVGLIMADHAKCAINTMFNTATVVGVGSNIFGAGFPKSHIPSFVWGGVDFNRTFILKKALDVAEAMMQRRGMSLTEVDQEILSHIFEETKSYRD